MKDMRIYHSSGSIRRVAVVTVIAVALGSFQASAQPTDSAKTYPARTVRMVNPS